MTFAKSFAQPGKRLMSWPRRRAAAPCWRPSLSVALLGLGTALSCAFSPAPVQARPIAYAVCVPSNHTDWPCPSSYHLKGIIVIDRVDFAGMSSFTRRYDFDPSVLAFNALESSLLCDLRSASSASYCPDFPAGSGTMPLSVFPDTFSVDQTNLLIKPDAGGLPSVSLSYTAPAGTSITGERNFLALAFDLLVPLQDGASVTYGAPTLPGESVLSGAILCRDASGVDLNCGFNNPPSAFALHPVPTPLAVGGLPVLAHASRRLRRRIQLASR